MPDRPLPSSVPPKEPQLLRFRLRQLLLVVTLVSVLCAVLVRAEGPTPIVVLVGSLLVAAHVLGTLIGTRLRDSSRDVVLWQKEVEKVDTNLPPDDPWRRASDEPNLPRQTHLATHGHRVRRLVWLVSGGAVLGFVLGGIGLALTLGTKIGWPGWVVGTLSGGVLGTWIAFLVCSFSSIARHAWREAKAVK